jgi:hypothetical protein
MIKDTNLQAFPSNQNTVGMTLRDYFAAVAMQGIIASDACLYTYEEVSQKAWKQADAMLKARQA